MSNTPSSATLNGIGHEQIHFCCCWLRLWNARKNKPKFCLSRVSHLIFSYVSEQILFARSCPDQDAPRAAALSRAVPHLLPGASSLRAAGREGRAPGARTGMPQAAPCHVPRPRLAPAEPSRRPAGARQGGAARRGRGRPAADRDRDLAPGASAEPGSWRHR